MTSTHFNEWKMKEAGTSSARKFPKFGMSNLRFSLEWRRKGSEMPSGVYSVNLHMVLLYLSQLHSSRIFLSCIVILIKDDSKFVLNKEITGHFLCSFSVRDFTLLSSLVALLKKIPWKLQNFCVFFDCQKISLNFNDCQQSTFWNTNL